MVRQHNQDILTIPWCYSINGTTANLLAPQFSRMILGYDRVLMLGGQMKLVELDENQKMVLDSFENKLIESSKKRHVLLTGNYGNGKTIFGGHFGRMLIAKKRLNFPKLDNKKYKIVFVDCSADKKNSSPLSKMIKGYFKSEVEKDVEVDVTSQKILWKYKQRKLRDRDLQHFLERMLRYSADVVLIDEINMIQF